MIKYLGSKRLIVSHIVEAVKELMPRGKVLDLFSGTSRVGIALKNSGYTVHANDYLSYASTIAQCYIAADRKNYLAKAAVDIEDLNFLASTVSGASPNGFFAKRYAEEAWFFQLKNANRISAIRDRINIIARDHTSKAILLTSLMEAADRVDSTCGIQMAYLKSWAPRSYNPLTLRVPELLEGGGEVTQLLALECLDKHTADITYLDPPYNQHSYLGNYHIWETLVKWDDPEVYGKANKRVQVRETKSMWNYKMQAQEELKKTLQAVTSKYVILSYNNKGYLSREQIERALSINFDFEVKELSHPAYIGHKIGVYNSLGNKVGNPSSSTVSEFLFIGERR